MSNFVRNFKKFQKNKRNEPLVNENIKIEKTNTEEIHESVTERDNKYIISGISIPKSLVSTFASKAKKDSGKDVFNDFSKTTVAEELVRYMIDQYSDGKEIPMSALYGGGDDMERQVDEVSNEEEPMEVGDSGMEGEDVDFSEEEVEGEDVGSELDEMPVDFEEETGEGEEVLDTMDDEFETIDGESDVEEEDSEFTDENEEDLDLPAGDPITSDDIMNDEDEEKPRRKKRRFEEEEDNEEL